MLGYDTSLYEKGNNNVVIGDYALKAKTLYDKDIISESNYVDFLIDLGIKPEDISLNVFSKEWLIVEYRLLLNNQQNKASFA